MRTRILLLILSGGLSTALAADWQINWWTLDGGGRTSTNAGGLALSGTLGQPDAGVMTGGTLRLVGGFWGPFAANVPPTISTQPQSLVVTQGFDATFSVTATGTQPLWYQWRFNGTNIAAMARTSPAKLSRPAPSPACSPPTRATTRWW